MQKNVLKTNKLFGTTKQKMLLVPIFYVLLAIFSINLILVSAIWRSDKALNNYYMSAQNVDAIAGVKNSREVISTFSTDYSNSTEDRKFNIRLALKSLNGVVVKAGEEFSFNKAVGKRTEERGYKKALVIYKGNYTLGVGGGVCQVSSTLYNAWLLAGLDTVSIKAHSLPSSYVDLSRDATVSEYIDMVLLNPLPSDVQIKTSYDDNSITIQILGAKRQYDYILQSETLEILPFGEDIIQLDEIGEDEYYVGKVGYKSRLIITILKEGRVVAKRVLRKDYYIPQNSVKIQRKSVVN